jgi:hypothetical protein
MLDLGRNPKKHRKDIRSKEEDEELEEVHEEPYLRIKKRGKKRSI